MCHFRSLLCLLVLSGRPCIFLSTFILFMFSFINFLVYYLVCLQSKHVTQYKKNTKCKAIAAFVTKLPCEIDGI
jgi:hypothetical protein